MQVAIVSPAMFEVLQIPPILGRVLERDDALGTIVISHELWVRRYGADPDMVGRDIEINQGSLRPVVGVMPPGFDFPHAGIQLWYAGSDDAIPQRAGIGPRMFLGVVARLRPGVSAEAATRDVQRMIGTLPEAFSDIGPDQLRRARFTGTVVPLKTVLLRDVRPVLWILFAAAGVLLIIVWVNTASLVLLRAERQRHETAVQVALGASTRDLALRSIGDALLLAAAGGLGGWAAAHAAVMVNFGFEPHQLPRLEHALLAMAAARAASALALVSAGLIGVLSLARALQVKRSVRLVSTAARATPSRERRRMQQSLVAAQIALALALLIGSAMLAESFRRLSAVDLGFDPAETVALDVALPARVYGEYRLSARFYVQLLEQLRSMVGVASAEAVSSGLPLTPTAAFTRDALMPVPRSGSDARVDTIAALSALVSPGYFHALRIPILEGRTYRRGDLVSSERPVVISAALARSLFPDGPALGRQLRFASRADYPLPYTVVGIAGDVPDERISATTSQRLYLPLLQDLETAQPLAAADGSDPRTPMRIPYTPLEMTVLVRTTRPASTVAADARRIIRSIDAKVPLSRVRMLDTLVAESMARIRIMTVMFMVATGASLALGIIGIYGVISYSIAQRTPEFGVRLALGASPRSITEMILRQAAHIAVTGSAAGLGIALLLTRLLRGVLYQISVNDPAAFVLMPLLLFVVALLAAYVPARRAARVDMVKALRAE